MSCSACAFRYENNNIDLIQKCCYESCPQFDVECKNECNKCLEKVKTKCKKNCSVSDETFSPSTATTYFKSCMDEWDQNPKEALRCCLQQCGNDFEAQERCIDAYNSLRPIVYEDFQLKPELRSEFYFEPSVIVLVFSVIFHLLILGKSIELPQNRLYAMGTILLFYFTLYLFIQMNKK